MNKTRTWTIILTGVGLLALLLLAVSVNALQLAPGQQYGYQQAAPNLAAGGGSSPFGNFILAAFRVLMSILWLALPLYILLAIVNKDMRKRLLKDIAIFLPIVLLLVYLSNQKPAQQAAKDINPNMFGQQAQQPGPQGPAAPLPPQFVPPPGWVTTLTTVAIAVAITLIVLAVVYGIWRRARANQAKEPLQRVEKEAQAAIDAIGAGGDLREVIMRCYLQMIQALQEYRGIHRGSDMTPREFELTLQKRGLPGDAVHQLTRLFEQVRYGTTQPGRTDERAAVDSLAAIVSACQRTRAA